MSLFRQFFHHFVTFFIIFSSQLTFTVDALHILEDVSSGDCSVLNLVGKAAQWEKDKRRPGWMNLLISDALTELDLKPPLEHTFQSLRGGSGMHVSGLLDEDGRPLSIMKDAPMVGNESESALAGAEGGVSDYGGGCGQLMQEDSLDHFANEAA